MVPSLLSWREDYAPRCSSLLTLGRLGAICASLSLSPKVAGSTMRLV